MTRTSIGEIVSQVHQAQLKFVVSCFNCPSGIKINDTLIILRPADTDQVDFTIIGYNTQLKKALVCQHFGRVSDADFYLKLSELGGYVLEYCDFFDRTEPKILRWRIII